MTILDAILQGIIQGLTEFLPVSSSGHLMLYAHISGNAEDSNNFLFSAFLHLGTLLATCLAFRDTVTALAKEGGSMISDLFKGQLIKKGLGSPERRMLYMLIISLAVLVPFYFVRDFIEGVAEKYIIALGCFFLYTSVILFLSDRCKHGKKNAGNLTWKEALTIGIFQAIALFPGISRSGSTICGALFVGTDRDTAVKYSFMLGIPTILAGCLVEIKDAADAGALPVNEIPMYLVGFVVAAVVGIGAIKLVDLLVKNNKFKYFAVYTFLLGLTVAGYGIYEVIR
ncbi:MAG: undecaprenyl-diphosphate phosphatase [Oscillospiraceae bacterium]|nr:undecaprenyl-diphosphate phosphatase [Oscillospiraceae bacterium]MDE5884147.1 undecaprenyl-diphosphate phosphatase [Oscillospiraceae bacterium]